MDINYLQVQQMTHQEKVKMYAKFSKKEIINMLIECNTAVSQLMNSKKQCNYHNWVALPSIIRGVFRYQCMNCGSIITSDGSECKTTNKFDEL